MLSVVGRRCPAAKNHGGAAAPPYLEIRGRETNDTLRHGSLPHHHDAEQMVVADDGQAGV